MFLDDIATLLEGAGISATRILASSQRNLPSEDEIDSVGILHLRQYRGLAPERTHNSTTRSAQGVVLSASPAWQRPQCQVLVVAPTFAAANALSYTAYYALVAVRNRTVNGCRYREIDALQEPFDDGSDDNGHARVVFNVRAIKRPS